MGVTKEFSISREFRSLLDTFAQTVTTVVRVWSYPATNSWIGAGNVVTLYLD